MTSLSPAAEPTADPACPFVARPIAFEAIPRATWDRLLASTARATPFSRWTWHRAWWDAYGATAHAQYLACVPAAQRDLPLEQAAVRGIVPLMHRHAVGADGADAPDAKVVYFAASYHADYATVLCAPADLPDVARAAAAALAGPPDAAHGGDAWDTIDLRRLRSDDPALDALARAFEGAGRNEDAWTVERELEDVCPVVSVAPGLDWDGYLATLDKKDRHEIRRKIRRAEAAGPNVFRLVEPSADAVERFIELHHATFGEVGLFPNNSGGARSRQFIHRLAALETAEGAGRQLQLGQFEVAGRLIFVSVGFDDGSCYFYNAGKDPAARDLSPGVAGTAAYLRAELARDRHRFDFLRGREPYKYEWGAQDEPIHRILVRRTVER